MVRQKKRKEGRKEDGKVGRKEGRKVRKKGESKKGRKEGRRQWVWNQVSRDYGGLKLRVNKEKENTKVILKT